MPLDRFETEKRESVTRRKEDEEEKLTKKNRFSSFLQKSFYFLCPSSTFFSSFHSRTTRTSVWNPRIRQTVRIFHSTLYHHVSFFPFLMRSIEFIPLSKPNFALILNIDEVSIWLYDFFLSVVIVVVPFR